jgi:flagellar export protein FliJ
MKKFSFTLQSLFRVTLSMEKSQKVALKKIEDMIAGLKQELEHMKDAYFNSKQQCAKDMQKGVSGEMVAQHSLYFESLINAMIAQKDHIIQAEEEREKRLTELIKTRRKIQTLEKIRESQYFEYLEEVKREEEKEIGDLVSFQVISG